YAFGGWENRWTLLGVSQAYARIATGREVQASFLHRDRAPADTFARSSPGARAERPALPRIHRDFAEGPLSAVLSRQWGRVSGCPAPSATADRPQQRQASK